MKRQSGETWKEVLTSAAEEARRRGDRRIGTDHLLLGLLHDEDSSPARALGVTLEAARAASSALDTAALAAVDVEVGHFSFAEAPPARRFPPLTSGTRAVLRQAAEEARPRRAGHFETRHMLLALLSQDRPDPAAELLRALDINTAGVRDRLTSE